MPNLLVLGFDTSGPWCAAVLRRGSEVLSERHEHMQKGQAERLMPLLEEMLTESGCTWGDLHRIGVGVGPGNFTGIRLAVSAARGLALGLNIPAIGVTSFQALALGSSTSILTCVDARGGKVYLQLHGRGVYSDLAPCIANIDALPQELQGLNLYCVGSAAGAVAEQIGGTAGPAAYAHGSAIARIAAAADQLTSDRPAPFYLRDADAAPPREAPPKILA